MQKISNKLKFNWFSNTEILLSISAIGGSVASIIFQQVAIAAISSIPLSLAISLNSHKRKFLENITQQYQTSFTQLEQQFLRERELKEKFFLSLSSYQLADIESRLESHNLAVSDQLDSLEEKLNTHLALQPTICWQSEVFELQQRINLMENFLKLYNLENNRAESQKTFASIKEKIHKLELQFDNLPLFEFQYQLQQVQQLVDELHLKSTESTKLYTSFLGKLESVSQQIQALTDRTEEVSSSYLKLQSQLTLVEAPVVDKLRDEIKFLYTFVDKEFETLVVRVEEKINGLREPTENSQQLSKEVHSLRQQLESFLTKDLNKNTTSSPTKIQQTLCEHCHRPIQGKYVMGGYYNNYKFHYDCKRDYERKHEIVF